MQKTNRILLTINLWKGVIAMKKKHIFIPYLVLLMLIGTIGACKSQEETTEVKQTTTTSENPVTQEEQTTTTTTTTESK